MMRIDCQDATRRLSMKMYGRCRELEEVCYNCACDRWGDATKLVYLAYAIDNAKDKNDEDLINKVVGYLSKWFTIYDPKRAFSRTRDYYLATPKIARVNLDVIGKCDLFVAIWDPSIPSVGVPVEIEYALSYQIPIIIVIPNCEPAERSVYFKYFINRGAMVISAENIEDEFEELLREKILRNG